MTLIILKNTWMQKLQIQGFDDISVKSYVYQYMENTQKAHRLSYNRYQKEKEMKRLTTY